MRLSAVLTVLGILAAVPALAGPDATGPEPISDAACLRKLALDLTHRGPSAAELAAMETKTATLSQLADAYLASDEFSQVAFDWFRREFPPTSITPAGIDTEEPARIARYIVVADRDYREVLTGRYTVARDGTVSMQQGRPAAGVLSTPHYMTSALGLYRRNWAGRYERQWTGIVLSAVTLPEGTALDVSRDGIAANPACAGCHVHPVYGIDGLAKFVDCWKDDGSYDGSCVAPTGRFLDRQGAGLIALAQLTAESPEWKAQMVTWFFKHFFGRGLARSETDCYLAAAEVFEKSGFRAKALIKHFVTSPAYCAR